MMRTHLLLPLGAVALTAACSDAPRLTSPPPATATRAVDPTWWTRFDHPRERFVAIGTSISMGWASNGVYDKSQLVSWPSLLEFASGTPMSLPLIQSPGCTSPLIAPLGAGKRLSGESAAGSTVCAPNDIGVTLPTQNLALAGAIAADALQKTSEEGVATGSPWYARVLPPGTTQLSAALAQQPTFVSVELGGNDVLGALSGLFAPGITVVPFPFFAAPYGAILDALGTAHPKALLFEMPSEARNLPAIRGGNEVWADRLEFAALNVDVSTDCNGSPNYINVSIKSLELVFTAAFTSTHGLPNPVFSCADIPGTADLVLTPADIAAVNAELAQMRAFVEQQAASRGYAVASLGALYDMPNLKPPTYSVISQLTSPFPFGPFISLDGVHPSIFGHAVLAFEAARAINTRYGHAGDEVVRATGPSTSFLEPPGVPDERVGSALELARRIAREHQGLRLSACSIALSCNVRR